MIKIFKTSHIRELDAGTIKREPIASIDLMERACHAFVDWFAPRFDSSENIGVVCGTGNNGGDGLGIARILELMRYDVRVWIVNGGKETDDFKINRERWLKGGNVIHEIASVESIDFSDTSILVDAMFGSGLSRSVEGIYAEVIEAINQSDASCVAVDIPSGLLADQPSSGSVIRAKYTVSFQFPKLAFLFPENEAYVGEWHVVSIGLDSELIDKTETPYYYVTKESVRQLLKPLSKFSHKGKNGRALLIAGSYGKMGACLLAARAALRSGLGLLTTHIPKAGYPIIQSQVPEAMVSVDDHDHHFSSVPLLDGYGVVGIGPGLGVEKETIKAFTKVLQSGKAMVIDADALNILGASPELLHLVPPGCILTPHPKEFERLVGTWKNDFDRLSKQIQLARQLKSVVVLKGAHSSIALPGGSVFFNSSGNPGMAKGGSGDVLTGILTGLMAQGYSATDGAILGVFLHGLAGDAAAAEVGMRALLPSDIIDFLPKAYRHLESLDS